MGALRTKMIEEMKLRNFSPRTEQSYVSAMVGLVKYLRQRSVPRNLDKSLKRDEDRCCHWKYRDRNMPVSILNS